jgi:hypothetical protein
MGRSQAFSKRCLPSGIAALVLYYTWTRGKAGIVLPGSEIAD